MPEVISSVVACEGVRRLHGCRCPPVYSSFCAFCRALTRRRLGGLHSVRLVRRLLLFGRLPALRRRLVT